MAFTYAGQYGPEQALGSNSVLLKTTIAYIYNPGTTTFASLFTDRTKATPVNQGITPVYTDALGNLKFFADPGTYDVAINGSTLTVFVPMDQGEIADITQPDTFTKAITFTSTVTAGSVTAGPPSGGDDSATLNTLMAGATEVVLRAGATYAVAPSALSIPAGVTLRGQSGSKIVATTSGIYPIVTVGVGSTLRDVIVDAAVGAPTYVIAANANNAVLRNVTVQNNPVGNGGAYGVHVTAANDVHIIDCTFTNIASYGVLVEGACARTLIRGCVFRNTTAGQGQGVTVKTSGGTPTDTSIVDNIVTVLGIIGLEIQSSGIRGIINNNVVNGPAIGISLSGATGCTVSGNTISNCSSYGIEAAQASIDCTIGNNTLEACGVGIIASSPSASPQCRNILVTGNAIRNSTSFSIQLQYGLNISVTGNQIDDGADEQIRCTGPCTSLNVSNNHLYRSVAGSTSSGGMNLFFTSYCSVVGNIVDNGALATQAGYGITVNGGTFCSIKANACFGHTKGIAIINGVTYHLVGNLTGNTSQHSVYTQATNQVIVDAHMTQAAAGVGVDLSGATIGHVGSYSDTTINNWTSAVDVVVAKLLYEQGVVFSAVSTAVGAQVRTMIVTATGQTITLPAVYLGRKVTVKLTVAGTCTVSPASGTIDGAATDTINTQWQSVDYLSDGVNWFKV